MPGFETVVADARALPFPDRSFDQVLLVSTLEHIGADNEVYGVEGEPDDTGRAAALRELRRVLRPVGSLLVTVPLGEPGDYGWFRQEDVARLDAALHRTRGSSSRSRRRTSSARTAGARLPTFDPDRRRLRHTRPGGIGGALRRAQPAAAAAARLAGRRAAHRPAPARPAPTAGCGASSPAVRRIGGCRGDRQLVPERDLAVADPEHRHGRLAGAVARVTRASREGEGGGHLVAG